ncbi:MAG: hypothetical protein DRO08_01175 [Thermoprotei archaeon]|nr:MAG: hypothetical protein DRO08_01175 [Thermoprotei archaeon]
MISKAFEVADHVIIGVMKDNALEKLHKICRENVEPYERRVKKLLTYVSELLNIYTNKTFKIVSISGPYDIVLEKNNIDYIIVSDETLPRAVMINILRRQKKMKEIKVIIVPIVKDIQGRPISSHRFRVGEIQ